ncbi:formate/nitrite transporter family protein [Streptomyces sp. NPDC052494]|uniref:formate/nitrite transporter family protein n=1 Tax=Streptomyces sp. NPDC052494 TaxID=3365692 RepID=UPI0037D65EC2
MISVAENLRETAGQAEHKAHDLARPGRYAVSAMLAGAYIGIGEVLLLVAVSPFVAEHAAAARLLEGAVFPVALTIVMFAGAQLFTSNVMVMLLGALSGRTGVKDLVGSWVLSLGGNLVGAFAFGAMVHASGVLSAPSARAMLAELVVGFEHGVANMALFSLAILDGTAGFGDLGRSLLFTVPGNIVGGGALVACTYWFTGRPDRASDSSYE